MFIILFYLAHFEISKDTGINTFFWGEKSGFGYSHTFNLHWQMENSVCFVYSGGITFLKMYRGEYNKGYEFYERLGIGKKGLKDRLPNSYGGIILVKFSFRNKYNYQDYRPLAFGGFFESNAKFSKIMGINIYLYGAFNLYIIPSFFLEPHLGIRLIR